MEYSDKLKLYKEEFGIYGFENMKDKYRLLSLVCILTKSARSKDANIRPFDVMIKLNPDMKLYGNIYERVSLECDSLLSQKYDFDSYGYKKASDIVAEIRRIFEEWMPF